MSNKYVDIESISDLHNFYAYAKPKHPLITLIDLKQIDMNNRPKDGMLYRLGFYSIFFKTGKGILKYGKSNYDFDEGSLMFTAPYQVISPHVDLSLEEGWGLFFHPDILNRKELGSRISEYSFFQYDSNEALHISDEEKELIKVCVENIKREYSQNIDKHTLQLILSNIELLLNYCNRFYDRQFFTRAKISNDIVQRFEKSLKEYFAQDTLIKAGLPDVKYFAAKLNLSANYLSDLLNKYTGKTTQEHIHLKLVDKAKSLLWGSEMSISEIAYELGFEHPSHFTKLFKSKIGQTPKAFRNLN
ncbi:AraC-like DNA-binding protein [Pedobacter cryoconitis]|uniref:helix-turn-helix domain-containing protein n=1 Tax=Pedobacter cryoconitis TaxID=188932 RepID=UPI00161130F9|nr:helix-turn-helix domain-containing protein [Pedobacter cryoconitis]MBB6273865.1 AraC-like DNA-binding protein [Pedobacter cryoconitis]